MKATLLLCDAAQVSGGKLYVMGGGWALLNAPNMPVNMALAVLLEIDWNEANERHTVEAKLMTDDGEAVEIEGQQVSVTGQVEVGRPPGLKPGMNLNAPMALAINGMPLPSGGYRWELHVDSAMAATAPFRVTG